MVLTEENGDRRIPIIIGGFEAQAIAIQLEGLNPPRPLTHDLFLSFASAFDVSLIEVNIYRLEEGVFYSKLVCVYKDREVTIDARTSDAIALALRFKCPIFTTEEIMAQSGIVLDIENETDDDDAASHYYRGLVYLARREHKKSREEFRTALTHRTATHAGMHRILEEQLDKVIKVYLKRDK